MELEGVPALCAMLEQLGFYPKILRIIQSLSGIKNVPPPSEYLIRALFGLAFTLVQCAGARIVKNLMELKFFHVAAHVCFMIRNFVQDSPHLPDRMDMFSAFFGLIGIAVDVDERVSEVVGQSKLIRCVPFTIYACGCAILVGRDCVPILGYKNSTRTVTDL